MGQENGQDTELVRAAHIVRGISQSISETGRAMLVFEIEDGSKFAITMPPSGLKPVRSMIDDLINVTERMNLSAGMTVMHRPREVQVGHSDHLRGTVAVTFNPGAKDEMIFLLPNEVGLGLSVGLRNDILPRMTQAERVRFEQGQRTVLHADRPKLILPR